MTFKSSLNLRLIFAYFVVLGFAVYFVMNTALLEFKPGVRKATEDALVDISNLLAQLVEHDLAGRGAKRLSSENVDQLNFQPVFDAFLNRQLNAKIFEVTKQSSELRVYITDHQGLVVFDSANLDLGADFSQWNDVYLTLRGRYGVRTTPLNPYDDTTTVMYVAAPIHIQGSIAGVLTVSKRNVLVQPFIDNAQSTFSKQGMVLLLISCLLAIVLIFFMTRSIRKLVKYSEDVAEGRPFELPQIREQELDKLAKSMEKMRHKLDGKAYVEQYVHSLTHELKSPVAGIKGAAELIALDQSPERFERFRSTLAQDAQRIESLINQLLKLAAVEQLQLLTNPETCQLFDIINQTVEEKAVLLSSKQLSFDVQAVSEVSLEGDRALLKMAIDNLLQNAIDFADPNSIIKVGCSASGKRRLITVQNAGPNIPDYAFARLFERFYSLPRPQSQQKSSGLGLCFVKQITQLHRGEVKLSNFDSGVLAQLIFD